MYKERIEGDGYEGESTDMMSLKGDTEPGEDKLLESELAGLGWLEPTLPLVFLFLLSCL